MQELVRSGVKSDKMGLHGSVQLACMQHPYCTHSLFAQRCSIEHVASNAVRTPHSVSLFPSWPADLAGNHEYDYRTGKEKHKSHVKDPSGADSPYDPDWGNYGTHAKLCTTQHIMHVQASS